MGQASFKRGPLSSSALARLYCMTAGAFVPGLALAGPTGGSVVAGQAGITTPNTGTTVVNQQSQNAIINWQQFSVGGNEFVLFNQPNASAAVLNRVVGGLPSEILGNLSANGRVFLVNPQGIMIGQGARIDVGGLVASTMDIQDQDFMSGRHVFAQGTAAPGTVRNEGRITAGPGGFVVLTADRVENAGLIQAERGEVLLASGSKLTLTVDAEGLVGYSIDAAALSGNAGIENVGEIVANGGTVVLDAKVARSLIGNVVNNRGRITAQSVEERDGAIYLLAEGGNIENSGTLDASGTGNADGGSVIVHGDQDVTLTETGVIRADGAGSGDGGLIRMVAEGQADTAPGSLISATAGPAGTLGGFVELSGHGGLKVRGEINVGRGGRILIDPTFVNIANGTGTSGSSYGGATVYEQFIETQLQGGADVAIVANNRITLQTLADGVLDGTNAGAGGDLLLGIGTVSSPTTNGVFVDGPPPAGFTFTPGPGGSSYGGIYFQTLSNAIRVDGRLRLSGGTNTGQISVGDLEGSDLAVSGADDISIQDITLTGASGGIAIDNTSGAAGSSEDVSIASITATGASSAALITIDANNNFTLANPAALGAAQVAITAGLDGSGSLGAPSISAGRIHLRTTNGGITVGSLSANGGGVTSFSGAAVSAQVLGSLDGVVNIGNIVLASNGAAFLESVNSVQITGTTVNVGTGGNLLIQGGSVSGSMRLGSSSGSLAIIGNVVVNAFNDAIVTAAPALSVTGNLSITQTGTGGFGSNGIALGAVTTGGDLTIDGLYGIGFSGAIDAGGVVNIQSASSDLNLQGISGDRVILSTTTNITTGTISAGGGGIGSGTASADVHVTATSGGTVNVAGVTLASDGYIFLAGTGGVLNLDLSTYNPGAGGTLHVRTNFINFGSSGTVTFAGSFIGEASDIFGANFAVTGDLQLISQGSVTFFGNLGAGGVLDVVADNDASGSSDSIFLTGASGQRVSLSNTGSVGASTITAGGGGTSSVDADVRVQGGGIAVGTISLASTGYAYVSGSNIDNTDGSGVRIGNYSVGTNGTLELVSTGALRLAGSSSAAPAMLTGNLIGRGASISGNLSVTGNVLLSATGSLGSFNDISAGGVLDIRANTDGAGSSEAVNLSDISGQQVSVSNQGFIAVNSITAGGGGSSSANAAVRVVSGGNGIDVGAVSLGSAGYVYFSGGNIDNTDGSGLDVNSYVIGASGTLQVVSTGALSFDGSSAAPAMLTGNLIATAASIDGAQLSATGNVLLDASGGVAFSGALAAGGLLQIDATTAGGSPGLLSLGSATADQIKLSNAGDIALGLLTANGGSRAGGDVQVTATGSGRVVLIGTTLNTAGTVEVSAAGGASFAGSYALGGSGTMHLTSGGNVVVGQGGGLVTVDGNLDLDVTGNVDVGFGVVTGPPIPIADLDVTGLLSVDATGDINLSDFVSGDRVLLTAGGGIGVGTLNAGGGGVSTLPDVRLLATGSAYVGSLTLASNGYAIVSGQTGISSLDVASFSVGTGGTLELNTNANLDFGTTSSAAFSLTGSLLASGNTITGNNVSASAGADLTAQGSITLTGLLSAGGLAQLRGGQGGSGLMSLADVSGATVDIANSGSITVSGGLTATTGNLDVSATDDVTVTGLVQATLGLASITAGADSISGIATLTGGVTADRIDILTRGNLTTGALTTGGGGGSGSGSQDILARAFVNGVASVGTISATPNGYVEIYGDGGVTLTGGANVGTGGTLLINASNGAISLGTIAQGGTLTAFTNDGSITAADLTGSSITLQAAPFSGAAGVPDNITVTSVTATGNVLLQANNDLTATGLIAGGGQVTLEAGKDGAGVMGVAGVTGNRIDLANNGNITISGTLTGIATGGGVGNISNPDVDVYATAGAVDLAAVSLAGPGYVHVQGDTGLVATGAAFNVAGGMLELRSGTTLDFGTTSSAAFSLTGNMTASGTNAVVGNDISVTGNLILAGLAGSLQAHDITAGGNINLDAGTGIAISGLVQSTGPAGIIRINAFGTGSTLSLSGGVSGDRIAITLFNGGTLTTGALTAGGGGGSGSSSNDIRVRANNGGVANLGTISATPNGYVDIYGDGGVTLTGGADVGTGGTLLVNANNGAISLGTIAQGGTLSAFTNDGSITAVNLTGATITLQAAPFSGTFGVADDITVNSVTATGDITLQANNDLTATGLISGGGSVTLEAGKDGAGVMGVAGVTGNRIDLSNNGNITVSGTLSGPGTGASFDPDVDVRAIGGTLDVAGISLAGPGYAYLQGDSGLVLQPAASYAVGGGTLELQTNANLDFGTTSSAAFSLTGSLLASGNTITGNNVSASAGADLTAQGSITLTGLLSAGGLAQLRGGQGGSGLMSLADVSGATVDIANSGSITVSGGLTATTGNLSVSATDDVTVTGLVQATLGRASITAGADSLSGIALLTGGVSADQIDIFTRGNLTTGALTAGGGGGSGSGSQDILARAFVNGVVSLGTISATPNGYVEIFGDGGVTLSGGANVGAGGTLRVDASNGAISLGTIAQGGALSAFTNDGSITALSLTGTTIALGAAPFSGTTGVADNITLTSVTATGDVTLQANNDLTATGLISGGGQVTLEAGKDGAGVMGVADVTGNRIAIGNNGAITVSGTLSGPGTGASFDPDVDVRAIGGTLDVAGISLAGPGYAYLQGDSGLVLQPAASYAVGGGTLELQTNANLDFGTTSSAAFSLTGNLLASANKILGHDIDASLGLGLTAQTTITVSGLLSAGGLAQLRGGQGGSGLMSLADVSGATVDIANSGSITVSGGLTATAGNLSVSATDDVTVTGLVQATLGRASITAGADSLSGIALLTGGVSADQIDIFTRGNLTTGALTAGGGGGSGSGSQDIRVQAFAGGLASLGTISATPNGYVDLYGDGGVTLSGGADVGSGGTLKVDANNGAISLGTIAQGGALSAFTNDGSITAVSITGTTIALGAAPFSGTFGVADDIMIGSVTATDDITLQANNDLTATGLISGGGQVMLEAGKDGAGVMSVADVTGNRIDLSNNGSITVSGTLSGPGTGASFDLDVEVRAIGGTLDVAGISLAGPGYAYLQGDSGLVLQPAGSYSVGGGTLELQTNASLDFGTATTDAFSLSGTLVAGAGSIVGNDIDASGGLDLSADGAMTLGGLLSSTGLVTLRGGQLGTSLMSIADVSAATVDISNTGSITVSGGVTATVGNLDLVATDDIMVAGLLQAAAGVATITAGADSASGLATLTGGVSADRIDILTRGNLTTGALTAGGGGGSGSGSNDIRARAFIGGLVSLGAISATPNGYVDIYGDGGVMLTGGADVGAGGTLRVNANNGAISLGTVTQGGALSAFTNDGSISAVNLTGTSIMLGAAPFSGTTGVADNITLTSATATGDVTLQANNDLTATGLISGGGQVTLEAGKDGAGVMSLQDVMAGTVDLSNNGSITVSGGLQATAGNLTVVATDDIMVTGLTQATGLATIRAGADSLSGIATLTGGVMADRVVVQTRGNLTTGALTAGGGGGSGSGSNDISVQAFNGGLVSLGAISATPNGYVDIFGDGGVMLTGGANVGAGGTLRVNANTGGISLGTVMQGGALSAFTNDGSISAVNLTGTSIMLSAAPFSGTTGVADNITLTSVTATGDITLQANNDLTATGLISGGGQVTLEAGKDGAGVMGVAGVTANRIDLSNNGNITVSGTLSGPGTGASFDPDVTVVASGGAVDVAGISLAGPGHAYLQGDTGIVLSPNAFDVGGGTLQLQTTADLNFGTGTADAFNLSGTLTANAGRILGNTIGVTGDLNLTAFADILTNATGLVSAGGVATINGAQGAGGAVVNLAGGVMADRILIGANGNITTGGLTSGGSGNSGSRDIGIFANMGSAVSVGAISATPDGYVDIFGDSGVTLTGGADVGAGGTLKVTANTGTINLGSIAQGGTLVVTTLADGSITAGSLTGSAIRLHAALFTGSAGGSDNITLDGAVTAATGLVELQANTNLAANNAVSAATTVLMTAGNDLTATGPVSGGGQVTLNGGNDGTGLMQLADVTGNGISITNMGAITVSGALTGMAGLVTVDATGGDLSLIGATAGSGVNLNATGGVMATGNLDGGSGGFVQVTAGGLINLGGTVDAGNDISLAAGTGLTVSGNISGASVGSSFVEAHTTTGLIDLAGVSAANGMVRIGDQFGGTTTGITTGALSGGLSVNVSANAAPITINGTVGGGSIQVHAAGALDVNGAITATGTVDIDGLTVDTRELSGATVFANASNALSVVGAVTASSGISLGGNGGTSISGLVDGGMGFVNIGDLGTGAIQLADVTGGDIRIGDMFGGTATSITVTGDLTASGTLQVQSNAGAIDLGALATNVVSGANGVTVTSGDTLAIGGDVSSTAGNLTLTAATGDVTLQNLTALAGSITADANGGKLSVASATAGTGLVLEASGDLISTNNLDGGTAGSVQARAGGLIDLGGTVDAGGSVSLDAGTGVTVSGQITGGTAGFASIDVHTTTGLIGLTDVSAVDGDIRIGDQFGGTTTGITTGALSAGRTITVLANAAGITINGTVAGGSSIGLYAVGGALDVNGTISSAFRTLDIHGQTVDTLDLSANQMITADATNGLSVVGAVTGAGISLGGNGGNGVTVSGLIDGGSGVVYVTGGTGAIQLADVRGGDIRIGDMFGGTASSITLSGDLAATGGTLQLLSISGAIDIGSISEATFGATITSGGTLVIGGDVTSTAGNIDLVAAVGDVSLQNLTATIGSITVDANGGKLSVSGATAGGVVDLGATGDVVALANLRGSIVQVMAGGLIDLGGTVDASEGVSLDAGTGVTVSGAITGAGSFFNAVDVHTTTGLIGLADVSTVNGDIRIGDQFGGTTTGITTGALSAGFAVNVLANAADITINGTVGGGTGIGLHAVGGALDVNGALSSAFGTLDIDGQTVDTLDLSGNQIIADATNGLSVVGAITATAGISLGGNGGNGVTVSGLIDGGSGFVDVAGGMGAIQLADVRGGDVQIGDMFGGTATSITVTGDLTASITVNVQSTSGAISLGALASNVVSGTNGVTVTSGGTLAIAGDVSSTAGNIHLTAAVGDLSLQNLTATAGTITVDANGGKLSVASATAGGGVDLGAVGGVAATGNLDGNLVQVTAGGLIDLGGTVTASNGISLDGGGGTNVTGLIDGGTSFVNVAGGTGAIQLADVQGGDIRIGDMFGGTTSSITLSGDLAASGALQLLTSSGAIDIGSISDAAFGATITSGGTLAIGGDVSSTAGNIDLTATTGDLSLQNLTALAGTITADANGGNLPVAAVTASGGVVLTSSGNLTTNGPITGATADLTAINVVGPVATTVTTTLGALNVNANILSPVVTLSSATSVFVSGFIDAGSAAGSITLTANNGMVTTGGITSNNLDVTADSLSVGDLSISGSLALTANAGDLTAGMLSAATVDLSAANLIDVNAVSASGAVTMDASDIQLGGPVDGSSVTLTANTLSGTVDISAVGGSVLLDVLSVNAPVITLSGDAGVTVTGVLNAGAASGSVTLTAINGLLQSGGIVTHDLSATATSVDITSLFGSANATLGGGLTLTALNGDITGGDLSAGGLLDLDASQSILVGNLVSTGDVLLTAVDIQALDITATSLIQAGGAVQTVNVGGVDYLQAAGPAANIRLGNLSAEFVQVGDFLQLPGGPSSLSADTIDVGSVAAGTVAILQATSSLHTGAVSASTGDVQLSSGGTITVDGNLSAANSLSVLGVSNNSYDASGNILQQFVADAADQVTINGSVNAPFVLLGALDLNGVDFVDNLTVNGPVTAGNVMVASAAGALVGQDFTAGTGGITLTAGSISSNLIDTTGDVGVDTVGSFVATSGINGSGVLVIAGSTQVGPVSAGAGGVDIQTLGGTLDVGAIDTTGPVQLSSAADLVSGGIDSTLGITVDAVTGISFSGAVKGSSVSLGAASVQSSGLLSITAVSGAANIAAAMVAGNGVTLSAATLLDVTGSVDAGLGTASLSGATVTAHAINGGGVVLTSSGLFDADGITAAAGGISINVGSADLDALTATGGVDANAASGNLTVSGPITADAVTLTALSGSLSTGGITATGAVTGDANSILLNGAVSAATVDLASATTLSSSGLLSVTATGGALGLSGTSISGNGIDLSASGALTLVGGASGGSGVVDLNGASITADNLSGGTLALASTGLIDADDLSSGAGGIKVDGGSVDLGIVDAGGGAALIKAGTGRLVLGSVTNADDVTLTASAGTLTSGGISATGAVSADANQILLNAAVTGATVDLASATTLSASGLLDVTATSGALQLTGTTISGNGIDLSASGGLTLSGNTNGGTGLVNLVGSSITADNINGGTLLLTSAGLIDTDDLTAGAGGVTVDGGAVDIGIVSTSGGGDALIKSGSGVLNLGGVSSADIVTLTANAGILTTGGINASGAVTADANQILLNGAVTGATVNLASATTLSSSGLLDITATSGTLQLSGTTISGNGIDLSATAALDIVGNANGGSGLVTIAGNRIGTDNISGGSIVATSGGLLDTGDLSAATGGISLGATQINSGILNAAGDVDATATNGNLQITSVSSATGVTLTAAAGTLTTGGINATGVVTADANQILLNGAVTGATVDLASATTLSSSGLLDVTATGGALQLAGTTISGNGIDLAASGPVVLLGNGDGSFAAVNISGSSITADNLSGSSIVLTSAGLIDTDDLSSGAGGIKVDGGSVDLGIVDAGGGTALIKAGSGRLVLGSVSNAGDVTLTATAGTLTSGAITGSGAVIADANQIVLNGAVSGTSVDFASATTLSSSGLLSISATGGTLQLSGTTISGNGIDLTATGALSLVGAADGGSGMVDLVGGSVTTDNISGNRIQLTATTGGVDTDDLSAGSGGISLQGQTLVNGGILLATGDVDATASTGNLQITQVSSAIDVTLTALNGSLTAGTVIGSGAVEFDAGSIQLDGAVSGASVDLDAATTLQSSGLLQVTATGGALRLDGSSVSGNGVMLSATGALSVSGNLGGGVVSLSGASILTDAVSGDSITMTSAGLIDTDDLLSGAGGILLTGGSIDAGALLASGGGDITATATLGDLLAGAVSGDIVVLAAAGDLTTAGITANQLALSAGGLIDTDNLSVGAGGAVLDGGSIDAGTIIVSGGGDLTATAGSGNLVVGDVSADQVDLVASTGSISAGDIVGQDVDVRAPQGSVTVGTIDSGGDANIDFGVDLNAGTLTLAGTLFADVSNTDVVFGNVNALAVDVQVSNGDIRFGNVVVSNDIRLDAVGGGVSFGDLSGQNITISFDQPSLIGSSTIHATGRFTLSGATLSGSLLDVDAQDIDIGTDLDFGTIKLAAGNGLVIGTTTIDAGSLTAQAATITLNGSRINANVLDLQAGADLLLNSATLTGGPATLIAGGVVSDGGGASTIDVTALGVQGASIDLRASSLHIGTGTASIGGDPALIADLAAADPMLAPDSLQPNASFIGGSVQLGALDLAGDHLYIETDQLSYAGPISAPLDLLVHFRPLTDDASLGIEVTLANLRDVNLGRDQHFNVFPGTTFVLGGNGYAGDIFIGENEPVGLETHSSNFVFATDSQISGVDGLATNGSVVVLRGFVVNTPIFEQPLLQEFQPLPPGDELTVEDGATEEGAEGSGDDFGAGEIEYESTPEDDALQCS